ncbi:MAG: 4Fe-4S dicluster domain-containing protein [Deltaproteobacteria bacterium]|nr:4Fe-4S dicluster domain-containing protein [Deltaproteobacteria bacterium]
MIGIDFSGRKKLYEIGTLREVCFQCSVCALHCVVQNVEGYDIRNTFVYDVFGSDDPDHHRALWTCSGCHKCHEVCPQDVNPARVIDDLREQSFKNGCAPSYVYDLARLVIRTGMAFPVTRRTLKEREKMGLQPIETAAAGEIRQIAGITGLLDKIEAAQEKDKSEDRGQGEKQDD